MGKRQTAAQKHQEESTSYKPGLSTEEKAKRRREAVAAHYRNHPEMREKKRLQMREARLRARKKAEKRRWDPPKKKRMTPIESLRAANLKMKRWSRKMMTLRRDQTRPLRSLGLKYTIRETRSTGSERPNSRTHNEASPLTQSRAQTPLTEEAAAEAFASQASRTSDIRGKGTTAAAEMTPVRTPSPLPPSSPPAPATPRGSLPTRRPGHYWQSVSPPQDDDDSPFPTERMPWPRLFKSLFGPKGDSPPDAEELAELFPDGVPDDETLRRLFPRE
ncbi:hypothetical protein B0H11DRAFT_1908854 [Mycena galericulata]|nr:hypothetical protein B0H11DRAFT_1908854 [Mycena galericulata]